MPAFSIVFALILIALGLGGFVSTGSTHVTALIPAFFGAFFLILGIVGLRGGAVRKHSMHIAAVLSLVGVLGGLGRSLPKLGTVLAGQPVEPSATAIWLQFSFGLLCLLFLTTCIRSFIQARLKAKTSAANL